MRRQDEFFRLIASPGDDCIIWPYALKNGYANLFYEGRLVGGHRLACLTRLGPPPPGALCAHSCDVPACINPLHVRWATAAENSADMVAHGNSGRGERSPLAKLTERQVREIRQLHASGVAIGAMVERYNVSDATLRSVVKRENWGWLADDEVAA